MRAISAFIFECGISTSSWPARTPLRMRVRKSAIGSVIDIAATYQLDFVTPGIMPCEAISRRQIRHSPNLR